MPSESQYNLGRQSKCVGGIAVSVPPATVLNRPERNAERVRGLEVLALLTESEVQRSFRNLFKTKDVPPDTFDKAEALLDELRPESPLRHRLSIELEEIRKLHTAKA